MKPWTGWVWVHGRESWYNILVQLFFFSPSTYCLYLHVFVSALKLAALPHFAIHPNHRGRRGSVSQRGYFYLCQREFEVMWSAKFARLPGRPQDVPKVAQGGSWEKEELMGFWWGSRNRWRFWMVSPSSQTSGLGLRVKTWFIFLGFYAKWKKGMCAHQKINQAWRTHHAEVNSQS